MNNNQAIKEVIRLILPFPPSVNGLYSGKARRFKSKLYVAWIALAKQALLYQEVHNLPDFGRVPLEVHYVFGKPDKRGRDVENYCKAVSDFLVDNAIIVDDSYIQRMVLEWGEVDGVEITISEWRR